MRLKAYVIAIADYLTKMSITEKKLSVIYT